MCNLITYIVLVDSLAIVIFIANYTCTMYAALSQAALNHFLRKGILNIDLKLDYSSKSQKIQALHARFVQREQKTHMLKLKL